MQSIRKIMHTCYSFVEHQSRWYYYLIRIRIRKEKANKVEWELIGLEKEMESGMSIAYVKQQSESTCGNERLVLYAALKMRTGTHY